LFGRSGKLKIKTICEKKEDIRKSLFLSQFLRAIHEYFPIRSIPVLHQSLNISQPDQPIHIMLEDMETQVQYLIVWVQAQGLLPLKIDEPGALIDVLFAFAEEKSASPYPISPKYVGVEVKGG
jgi:hypothetical protein